jgi:hypothetical protein
MKLNKATIIRSTEKKGMQTNYSEYIFHLSSYPVNGSIGFLKAGSGRPRWATTCIITKR